MPSATRLQAEILRQIEHGPYDLGVRSVLVDRADE